MKPNNGAVDKPTEQERYELRERYDKIVKTSGKAVNKLHLPHPDEEETPYCRHHKQLSQDDMYGSQMYGSNKFQVKDLAVYPPGHKEWCLRCVQQFRRIREREQSSEFDCQECDNGAFGVVNVRENTLYLCHEHYQAARDEYPRTNTRKLPK